MKHEWVPSKYGITLTRTVEAYDGLPVITRSGVRIDGYIARWQAPVSITSPLWSAIAVWGRTRGNAYAKARRFALKWHADVRRDVAAGIAQIEQEQLKKGDKVS